MDSSYVQTCRHQLSPLTFLSYLTVLQWLYLQKNCVGQEEALQGVSETAFASHNYPNEVASDSDLKILAQNWLPKNQQQASCAWLVVPIIEITNVL